MGRHRFGIALVAVATVSATIGAGVGMTGDTPPWLEAVNERSDALNKQYKLGDYTQRRALGAPGSGWREALMARSDAMNRYYGLGEYARQGAGAKGTPDWLAALNARSDGLNRHYGLGDHARTSSRR